MLGGSSSDLLLPKNFLIVEGLTEFELLTRVIRRFYANKTVIQIIKANGDIDQAERTINAIEKLFTPLGSSIYQNRVVLLLDCPSAQTEGGVNHFRQTYRHLLENNQLHILSHRDIEQIYPDQVCPTYTNWRKTQADLDATNAKGDKIITGKKKKQLAKYVGENISKEQFETDLHLCHQALIRCWELALQ